MHARIAFKGRLVQYVGRVLRPAPGKVVAEVHDYHDVNTSVFGSSLARRALGYHRRHPVAVAVGQAKTRPNTLLQTLR